MRLPASLRGAVSGPDASASTPAGAASPKFPSGFQAPSGNPPVRHHWRVLAVLSVSLLIISLDNTILNVALPAIVRSMHASSSELQWIVDAYIIVFAGLLLVAGSLGDRVGRKWVFMGGLLIFAAGSATSAFSGTPDQLIAARAFMGIGAAAIMPSTLSILINVFTDAKDRARAIGFWTGTSGLGLAAGPVAGGWLLAHYWWGSVFLINVPIAAVAFLAVIWLVPNSRNPASERPDPIGAGLSILGLTLLLWGIIEAPVRSWTSPLVLGAIAAAALVLTGFVLWERHSTHPMLQLAFFGSRRFSVAMGAMALVFFALLGGLFLLTQYLQFSLGYSALQAGLRVTPIAAVLLVAASFSTMLVRFLGTKLVVFTGVGLIAGGLGLVSRVTVHGTYLDMLPAFLLIGVGTGLAYAPCTESVMGSLPLDLAGVGSATNSTALQAGGALGVAVLGSLLNTRYQNQMATMLAHFPMPEAILDQINGSLGGALAVAHHLGPPLSAELTQLARRSFVSGMDLAVIVGAIVLGIAALAILTTLPGNSTPSPASCSAETTPSVTEIDPAGGYQRSGR